MEKIKIGIIREEKIPADKRVPLIPRHCRDLMNRFSNLEVLVQTSEKRSFTNEEYQKEGIQVQEDLSDCHILMGVKEVPVDALIPRKKYLFFSHTIKKQPYNKKLLQAILKKEIQMIDYECLKDKNGNRILGFGKYAGTVGTYNGIRGWGIRYNLFNILPAHECHDRKELNEQLTKVKLPNIKIVLTGGGRVASGAIEILEELKIKKVPLEEFLSRKFNEPVYCQLHATDYCKPIDENQPADLNDFYAHPEKYKSAFLPFAQVADLLITCHFWDPASPVLFTINEMQQPDFKISVIADITCDIEGSVPATIRASTIADPFYGLDPVNKKEVSAWDKNAVTMMAVDNLPCELPRDASTGFGEDLCKYIIPALLGNDPDNIIERASITKNGVLTEGFKYLSDYVAEKAG
jgi:saccharopine dehydrogenase (NAD+, L-lysine forming)